jgi:hypothetical protein
MAVKLNLSGKTKVEDLDRPSHVEAGWYRAKLVDVTDNDKSTGDILKFEIVGGRFDGVQTDIMIIYPQYAGDEAPSEKERDRKEKMAEQRLMALAARMGLISNDMLGSGEAEIDFNEALEREYVIECASREYTKKDGTKGSSTNITYMGIFPANHPDIPEQVRKDLKLPAAEVRANSGGFSPPAKAKPAAAGKPAAAAAGKKIDMSDL